MPPAYDNPTKSASVKKEAIYRNKEIYLSGNGKLFELLSTSEANTTI